jgi:hypothetical protein
MKGVNAEQEALPVTLGIIFANWIGKKSND